MDVYMRYWMFNCDAIRPHNKWIVSSCLCRCFYFFSVFPPSPRSIVMVKYLVTGIVFILVALVNEFLRIFCVCVCMCEREWRIKNIWSFQSDQIVILQSVSGMCSCSFDFCFLCHIWFFSFAFCFPWNWFCGNNFWYARIVSHVQLIQRGSETGYNQNVSPKGKKKKVKRENSVCVYGCGIWLKEIYIERE